MKIRKRDDELKNVLSRIIGIDDADFKKNPDQLSIIKEILQGKDVLTIISTGGGKSVCYQVPALCFPGLTLVISPLISLIEDQVGALISHGIEAACLTSSFLIDSEGKHYLARSANDDRPSARKLKNKLFYDVSNGKYKILYITPERLRTGAFIRFAQHTKISMIAVDEAHCISLWGYEFRPAYLEISRFLKRLGYHPVIAAFTATATGTVKEDILHYLDMKNPTIFSYPPKRDNLRFAIRHFEKEGAKKLYIYKWLLNHPEDSGIIYCSSTFSVDSVYHYLKETRGIKSITRYYADLNEIDREIAPLERGESKDTNFKKFKEGKARIMISTTALGMGIDKSDVRFVIHYELPTCIEDYYQEAGRAGRDGKNAYCLLCYQKDDEKIGTSLINLSIGISDLEESEREIRKKIATDRYDKMLEYCGKESCDDSELLKSKIMDYYENYQPLIGKENTDADLLQIQKMQSSITERISEIDVLYVNRTKIAGALRKGLMEGKAIVVSPLKSSPDALPLTVSYEVYGGTLSYFDMMVADAVYTLLKNKHRSIRAKHIMELLSGNPKLTLRPERKADVEESLRKMMHCNITIDRTNSLHYGFTYDDPCSKQVISGRFLPLKETSSGFEYDSYSLPPLYEYAEILNGQFYAIPVRRLNVPKIPTSVENLAIVLYLITRISSMRRNIIKGNRAVTRRAIRFDSMVDTLQLDFPKGTYEYNRRKATLVEKEKRILDYFAQIRYISYYIMDNSTGNVTEIEFLKTLPQNTNSDALENPINTQPCGIAQNITEDS